MASLEAAQKWRFLQFFLDIHGILPLIYNILAYFWGISGFLEVLAFRPKVAAAYSIPMPRWPRASMK